MVINLACPPTKGWGRGSGGCERKWEGGLWDGRSPDQSGPWGRGRGTQILPGSAVPVFLLWEL